KSDAEWKQAFDYMNRFDAMQGVEDIQVTINQARGWGAKKVGTLGYCLGGLLAYLCATRTDTDASVGYYGVNIPKFLDEAAKIKKPLMLHIAGKDGFVNAEMQAQMHKCLDGNPLVTLHDYPERDHAFTREGGKNYDAGDAKIADDRTLAFFTQNLA
ncbi:MAG: dienelactone hydrolase family protein, partial [Vitreimonas sp.]